METITFPDFWMHLNESGWHWVSNNACYSSKHGFQYAPVCMLDARHTLNNPPPIFQWPKA